MHMPAVVTLAVADVALVTESAQSAVSGRW